jgi:hypothetical protein
MSAVDQLRTSFKVMHDFLENTVADVTAEQAAWQPPGTAHAIGANYGHVLFSEDGIVAGMLRGTAPLMATRFAGKTGASELALQPPAWDEWARTVKVDLPAMREYAHAVYAQTDEYLAGLTEADLARELEFGPLGKQPISFILTIFAANAAWHTGEIACLKGLQGAKGYPF